MTHSHTFAVDSEGPLRAHFMRKADICAAALFEARRLSAAAMFGALYADLAGRISEMLEELDEKLLMLDLTSDRAAFERMAALHQGFEDLEFRRDHMGM